MNWQSSARDPLHEQGKWNYLDWCRDPDGTRVRTGPASKSFEGKLHSPALKSFARGCSP